MDFKIPAVIHLFNLCLYLLKRTTFSGKCLTFADLEHHIIIQVFWLWILN